MFIVNGNGTDIALDISGGWNFTGVIWVIGQISITGNTTFNGVVFAESGVTVDNRLGGNSSFTFSSGNRDSAFGLISAKTGENTFCLGGKIVSWKEIY
jgi:hypothetical protein